jgi:(1->4)-alpha-D-glucan 1-alpha-D-glucosylmutase
VRIDHPDGLRDPSSYFRQLQEGYVLACVRNRLPPERLRDDLARDVASCFSFQTSQLDGGAPPWPLYVVAEKILSEGEPLPGDWAVDGTTGYDFLNAVNGLFVAAANSDAFDRLYSRCLGERINFRELVNSRKKMIMLVSMASEINSLSHQLNASPSATGAFAISP